MDANTWNSYHIISNRARSICYATRQQQFRMKTEFTVNQLAHQAENHMELMDNLQVRQLFWYGVQVSNLNCVAHKVFNRPGSYSLAELITLRTFNIQNWFICSSIRNWIAYANEANIVKKDSPISLKFVVCIRLHLPSLTILVSSWYITVFVFFYLSKVLFAGCLQFKGNFVRCQNCSKYCDSAL